MDRLIWLENAEEEIDKVTLLLPAAAGWVRRSQLDIEWEQEKAKIVWRNIGWATMTNPSSPLIPAKDRLTECLQESIAMTSALHLGVAITTHEEIARWLEAVEGIDSDLSVAANLVRKLLPVTAGDNQEIKEWVMVLARLFFVPWKGREVHRYDHALEALRQRHEKAGIQVRKTIEPCFDIYLTAAKEAGRWDSHYRPDATFALLNQNGEWKSISSLALEIPGISKSALVRKESAQALGLNPAANLPAGHPQPGGMHAGINTTLQAKLIDYAERIGESLSRRQWGLFLVLLGPNARNIAPDFLENSVDVDSVRISLVGPDSSKPRIRLVTCHYQCRIVSGDVVKLVSLHGCNFDAPRETRGASLLIPQIDPITLENRNFIVDETRIPYRVTFLLRDPLALRNLSPQELRACLERTIQIHQREVLGVTPEIEADVSRIFDEIQRLDQLDLGILAAVPVASLQMKCFDAALSALWFDDAGDKPPAEFQHEWQELLRMNNFLQFTPRFISLTRYMVEKGLVLNSIAWLMEGESDSDVPESDAELTDKQREELEMLDPLLQPVLVPLLKSGSIPWPEIGYEATDEQGRCGTSMIEVAWPLQKIGIALPANDTKDFEKDGWTIVPLENLDAAAIEALFNPQA